MIEGSVLVEKLKELSQELHRANCTIDDFFHELFTSILLFVYEEYKLDKTSKNPVDVKAVEEYLFILSTDLKNYDFNSFETMLLSDIELFVYDLRWSL